MKKPTPPKGMKMPMAKKKMPMFGGKPPMKKSAKAKKPRY